MSAKIDPEKFAFFILSSLISSDINWLLEKYLEAIKVAENYNSKIK